ncbi:hypothetical protein KQI63_14775 [bacterium]|nr:hypothetical protein [bacterium]
MEQQQTMMTRELLAEHGIPFTEDGSRSKEWLVVSSDTAKPASLRNLGFRLGQGAGDIQYLIYFRGHFCGIML